VSPVRCAPTFLLFLLPLAEKRARELEGMSGPIPARVAPHTKDTVDASRQASQVRSALISPQVVVSAFDDGEELNAAVDNHSSGGNVDGSTPVQSFGGQDDTSVEGVSTMSTTKPDVAEHEAQAVKRKKSGLTRSMTVKTLVCTASTIVHVSALKNKKKKKERQAKFIEKHGADVAAEYSSQAAEIMRRIKESHREKRYVLHPGKSKWLGYWDIVSAFALLYTVSITPFEAAFVSPVIGGAAWSDPWFLVNRLLDSIFFVDMILQFFVAYQTVDARGVKLWVESHTPIVHHYVTTWFALDATTIFAPLTLDLYQASIDVAATATTASAGGENDVVSSLTVLRVLRVVRLVKLVRLVRASRMWERWKTKVTLSCMCLLGIQLSACVPYSLAPARSMSHRQYPERFDSCPPYAQQIAA
jgi:hypothetical protein